MYNVNTEDERKERKMMILKTKMKGFGKICVNGPDRVDVMMP